MLKWFSAREATAVGAALAEDFVLQSADLQKFMPKFLQRVDRDARLLQLNLLKRARLANSFKWRLLEKGVQKDLVEELTRALVSRLSTDTTEQSHVETSTEPPVRRPMRADVVALLQEGIGHLQRGKNVEAIGFFEEGSRLDPCNAVAHNNLGIALCKAGRYREGESRFRQALGINESYPDAQFNLGALLQLLGEFEAAEAPLRRAVELQPSTIRSQSALGINLLRTGSTEEARGLFEKVLNAEPTNANALLGTGQLAAREGRFAEAETIFKRMLEIDANAHGGWTGLATLRKMTSADTGWLRGAQACADSGLGPLAEADVRYAIGKYYNDLGDFGEAFRSYQRASDLARSGAVPYDRGARSRLVDDLIRVYTKERLSQARACASESSRPVLVVGMPRSGTSLVEQIIASHPAVKGAGELLFWGRSFLESEIALRQAPPDDALTRKLAQGYLRVLNDAAPEAQRVVDKWPFSSDFLGIVYGVFPRARVIYVRRNAIDACLSCFFQPFPPALNFTKDLGDLAHYYREHHRVMEHWRAVLPPRTLLDVPYEELIADQEGWTRRVVDFIGLDWDDRCLKFHATERPVLTASYWQVRQKLYGSSVGRWRKYEKFIAPLLQLKDLA
ncbi:MAG: sulfotransferase [Steroidobacteraceae bacterium]